MRESLRVRACLFRASCKKKAARHLPTFAPLRLSRIFGKAETSTDPDAIPVRRALLWAVFGVVLVAGLVLYFKFERVVVPLIT